MNMDGEGKYAFVEMRTEELASAALHLDKVELCGRSINVGRPKGTHEAHSRLKPPCWLFCVLVRPLGVGTAGGRSHLLSVQLTPPFFFLLRVAHVRLTRLAGMR